MGQQASAPPLTALVVDDEAPALSDLAYLLDQDQRVGSVRTVGSGPDALRALEDGGTDVVFCDIKMPGLDGLDLARVLARFAEPPQVVFVTAYEQHAVDAFDLHATDYLLKPVRAQRLSEAVRRVLDARDAARPVASSGTPTGPAEGPGEPVAQDRDETIPVELGGVTRFVHRSEVLWVEAQGDYARLHTREESHLLRVSLSTLEERWSPAGFARIHRSTLVALPHIDEVRADAGRCVVRLGDVELVVSRRHTRALRDRLIRSARPHSTAEPMPHPMPQPKPPPPPHSTQRPTTSRPTGPA
jgi:DNA-binding LytR/AlgR family response regulator